jgi:cystathionine gamma-synthase
MSDAMRFETAAIHAGQDPDPATGAAVVPIYQTSTYVQDSVSGHKEFEYSRTDNPTRRALETCLAALDACEYAVAFGSGMAAITTLALALKSGDRVLLSDDIYGGTYRLFSKVFTHLGVAWSTVDMTDQGKVSAALQNEVRLVIAETPTNPMLKIVDIEALAAACKDANALFAVDNTFATPYIQRCLDLGADVVLYSATKYLGGHSDIVMGSLATNDESLAERMRFLQNAAGAIPGPFDSWLQLRGLKTLAARMNAHCANAAGLAAWLDSDPRVTDVYYPGLASFPGHEIAARQMSASGEPLFGGMISVDLGSEEQAVRLCERTRLFWLGESLGGVESLIEHPGKMTHASLEGSGLEVSPGLVRISVGIEHIDDLKADLDQALS